MRIQFHRMVAGSLWLGLATLSTQLIQLAYAAFTARILPPQAFGAYAAALSATALITLLANSGLELATSRADSPSIPEIRSLLTLAFIIGLLFGIVQFLLSDAWARLWHAEESAPLLRLLSVSIVLLPVNGVFAGFARNQGRFRNLALVSAATALVGMVIALPFILSLRNALALAISPVASAMLLLLVSPLITGQMILPGPVRRSSWTHVRMGGQLVITSLIEYTGPTAFQLTVSRQLGIGDLGQLNRAQTLTVVPMQSVLRSVSGVLFPQLGQPGEPVTSPRRLRDASVVTTWMACVLGGAFAAGSLFFMTDFLGPGWQLAGQIGVLTSLGVAGSLAGLPMSIRMQSVGLFRRYWRVQAVTTCLYVLGIAAMLVSDSMLWGVAAFPAAAWVRYALMHHRLSAQRLIASAYRWELALACTAGLASAAGVALLHSLITGSKGLVASLAVLVSGMILLSVSIRRCELPVVATRLARRIPPRPT